jgi:hypothetical protein
MRDALDNKIQESEKYGFNVVDVMRHLEPAEHSPANGTVFRSRLISKTRLSNMEGTISISEFRYPPKAAAIENKCNAAGQPVTYCTSDFLGSVAETIFSKGPEIKPDYHFFVSEWIIPATPAKVFNTGERIPDNDACSPDERDVINEYLHTLEKCFTNREGYAFSSQFAQNILFGTAEKTVPYECEIITYPSIGRKEDDGVSRKTEDDWNNYAIVPSFFDKYQFHRVYLIKTPTIKDLMNAGLASFEFSLVGYADPDYAGIVRWKKPEENDLPQIKAKRQKSFWEKLFNNSFRTDVPVTMFGSAKLYESDSKISSFIKMFIHDDIHNYCTYIL